MAWFRTIKPVVIGSNLLRFRVFADVGIHPRCSAHSLANQQDQQALIVLVLREPEPFQSLLEGHRSDSHLINSVLDDPQRT